MVQQITLYTAKICPYAQRTELALEEVGAHYSSYQIDLSDKPVWYAPEINPASKVPAIAYGGPPVPADQPSPDSVKIAESLVLVQFISDLFPDSDLLPKDPVAKAQIRFFIEFAGTRIVPIIHGFVQKGGPADPVIEAYDLFQSLLPPVHLGKYLFGQKFTLADISIAPFLGRSLVVAVKNGLGKFDSNDGKKVWDTLQGQKYERLWQYIKDVSERKSWKDTFDEEYIISVFRKRYAN